MAFKVSYRMVQQSRKLGSWTENFWCDISDASQCLNQANSLKNVLYNLLAKPCYIPSYRVSLVGGFRQSTQILVPGSAPEPPTATSNADFPTTKVLLRFLGAAGNTKQWHGGLEDSWITQSGNYIASGSATARFNAVFAELTSNTTNWSINILNPNRSSFLIKSITNDTGLVTTNVNTLPADSIVRIKGVKGMPTANGIWRISVVDNTHFSLNGWTPTTQTMTKGTPTVRPQTYMFQKIQQAIIVGSTKHNVGKYPDQLSGKAKKRIR